MRTVLSRSSWHPVIFKTEWLLYQSRTLVKKFGESDLGIPVLFIHLGHIDHYVMNRMCSEIVCITDTASPQVVDRGYEGS